VRPFAYERPGSVDEAVRALGSGGAAIGLLAGGTCLLDLMKQDVLRPARVLDLNFAPDLKGLSITPAGALRIGAATTLAHLARDARVEAGWPLLHEAIVDGLTPQLRNAASVGGNIMQRPRCIYFREPGFACNKRAPGTGCAAQAGVHYQHALFGNAAGGSCIAVHPSDLCVALTALDAHVEVMGQGGRRTMPIAELHRLPGDDPTAETHLAPGELIVAVEVPPQGGRGGAYVKGSEGFALASAAALLELRDGRIADARLVLGGVSGKPWRSGPGEAALAGRAAQAEAFALAAQAAVGEAVTDGQTAFRVPMLRGLVVEALERALAGAEGRP